MMMMMMMMMMMIFMINEDDDDNPNNVDSCKGQQIRTMLKPLFNIVVDRFKKF